MTQKSPLIFDPVLGIFKKAGEEDDLLTQGGYTIGNDLTDIVTITSSGTTLTADGKLTLADNLIVNGSLGIDIDTPIRNLQVGNFLYVSSTDGRMCVGGDIVGTQYPLEVKNTSGHVYFGLRTTNAGSTSAIRVISTDTGHGAINFDGSVGERGRIVYTHSSDYMAFTTNGSEAMRIDNDGNVGIGTTGLGNKLQVHADGVDVAGLMLRNDNQAKGDILRIGFDVGYGGASGGFGTSIGVYAHSVQSGERKESFTFTTYDQIGDGIAERMRINYNGNVGIGTDSPSTLLDINSDKFRVRTGYTPTTSSGTGNQGDVCWDSNYVYVCVAENTWKRSALASW